MPTRTVDRLWLAGGALGAVLLLLVGWFLLVSPQRATAADLQNQTADADLKVTVLRGELAELRRQDAERAKYLTTLQADQAALPADSGLPDFLRQLHAAARTAGVAVESVQAGAPALVKGASTRVFSLPVSLTATGATADLEAFLRQLQAVQPRAMLISSADMSGESDRGLGGNASMRLGLEIFVAPTLSTGTGTKDK